MTDTVNVPRERVEAFLSAWVSRSGNGDIIYGMGMEDDVLELTVSDLRSLLAATSGAALISVLAEALHDRMFGVASLKDPAHALVEISDGGGLHEAAHELLRALPARAQPEAPKVEQEPVAWRWRYKGTDWRFGSVKPGWPEDEDEIVEPLYTHPAPASDELPNLWWNVEDWEETFDNIEDAYDAATGGEMRGIACLGNAVEQTRKYVVRVDIDTTGDGGADDYEIRTFDSLEAAEQQLAQHKRSQS